MAGRQRFGVLRAAAAALSAFVLAAAAAAAEPAPKKASFMPLWDPQAQFAGYYVALDRGMYRQRGIDLAILPGGSGVSSFEYLRDGKVDFAALWLVSALQRRAEGVPLVNVAQIVQNSSMLLVARKSSGIRSVADINGRKVGIWGGDFAIAARAFLERNRLQVRQVPQSSTVNLFLRGGVDLASAMRYNEYHTILNAGLNEDELQVFSFHDLGLNFPEDGLYALRATVERDPALADAFVAASLEGWQYAFAHPEQALDIVERHMRQAKVAVNRTHQRWMLARMRDAILPDQAGAAAGQLNQADYLALGRELQRTGLLRDIPPYADFARVPHVGR